MSDWDIPQGQTHPFLQFGVPEGAHAQQQRVAVLDDGSPPLHQTKLSETLTKIDVLCIGSTVVIDRPIQTCGGDILIYAQSLRIEQPLDTRPYFARTRDRFFVGPGDAGKKKRWTYALDVYFGGSQTAIGRTVLDYYQRCSASECVRIGGAIYSPELLGGMTPICDFNSGARPSRVGIEPPIPLYDSKSVQSGTITLLVGELILPTNGALPTEAPSPLDCSAPALITPYVLNAGGARGARGGLGNDFYEYLNATNTPGGPGGDAGTIQVFSIEALPPATRQKLQELSNVVGGAPGASEHVHMYNFRERGRRRPLPDGVCSLDFLNPWPASSRGAPGSLEVKVVDNAAAARIAANWARSHDSVSYYDFDELSRRAKTNRSISAISFCDFLEARLGGVLADGQTNLARDLVSTMLPNTLPGKSISILREDDTTYIPKMFALNNKEIGTQELGSSIAAMLRQLASHASSGSNPQERTSEYLLLSGGLLNSPTGDYSDSTENEQLLEILRKSNEYELIIASGINGLTLEVQALRVFLQRSQLEASLAALRKRIAAAERAARFGGLDLIAKQLLGMGNIASDASATYGKFRDAMDGSSETKQLLAGAGFYGKLAGLAGALITLGNLDFEDDSLRTELDALVSELREFNERSRLEREQLNREGIDILREALKARRQHVRQVQLRTLSFSYLLRRILILFNLDTSRREDVLSQSLDELLRYSQGDEVIQFDPAGVLRGTCGASVPPRSLRSDYEVRGGCLYWKTNKKKQIFWSSFTPAGQVTLGRFPVLTVVGDYEGSSGRPLFSFKIESRTFESDPNRTGKSALDAS